MYIIYYNRFKEVRVSSRHAEITFDSDTNKWSILDYSSNGTYVNYIKMGKHKKITLNHNDIISFVIRKISYKFTIPHPVSNNISSFSASWAMFPSNSGTNINNSHNNDNNNNNNNNNLDIIMDEDPMDIIFPELNVNRKRKRSPSMDIPNDNNDNNKHDTPLIPPKKKPRLDMDSENKKINAKKETNDIFVEKLSKSPKKQKHSNAKDVRESTIFEKENGLFLGVKAIIIAKKSVLIDIIMKKFMENGGILFDKYDDPNEYNLNDINTIIVNPTTPYIQIQKTLNYDETFINSKHIVTDLF